MTTKRHKTSTKRREATIKRHKMTTKIQQISKKRCKKFKRYAKLLDSCELLFMLL